MESFFKEIIEFAGRHPVLSLVWVVLLILVIYFSIKPLFAKVKIITRSEAIALLNRDEAVVVDIRLNDAFKAGHIVNAHNILPVDIKNGSVSSLEKYKTQAVIVVCDTGASAGESASKLNQLGFEKVFVLKEGISGWNGENLPLVRGNK